MATCLCLAPSLSPSLSVCLCVCGLIADDRLSWVGWFVNQKSPEARLSPLLYQVHSCREWLSCGSVQGGEIVARGAAGSCLGTPTIRRQLLLIMGLDMDTAVKWSNMVPLTSVVIHAWSLTTGQCRKRSTAHWQRPRDRFTLNVERLIRMNYDPLIASSAICDEREIAIKWYRHEALSYTKHTLVDTTDS